MSFITLLVFLPVIWCSNHLIGCFKQLRDDKLTLPTPIAKGGKFFTWFINYGILFGAICYICVFKLDQMYYWNQEILNKTIWYWISVNIFVWLQLRFFGPIQVLSAYQDYKFLTKEQYKLYFYFSVTVCIMNGSLAWKIYQLVG